MSNGQVFDLGLGKTTPFQPRPLSSYSSPYTYTNYDFVGPPEPGGGNMVAGLAAAAPIIAQGIGSLFGLWGQSRQDDANRRQMEQQQRQWDEMFAFQQAVRAEDMARYQAAMEAQAAYLAHEEAKSHGQWASRADARAPYHAASRAILGKTMGMDVPAYRPRYTIGGDPRESPYKDYIAPRGGERSA